MNEPSTIFAMIVVCFATALPALSAQGPEQTAEVSTPRTADGRPDLQGVWDFRTLTPMERPSTHAERPVLTAEEAADIELRAAERTVAADKPSDVDRKTLPVGGDVGGFNYNNIWFDRGAMVVDNLRTSLIVDPPNGRLPDLQPGIVKKVGGDNLQSDRPVRVRIGGFGFEGPEDRGLAERCILGFNAGPPIVPGDYNQNVQIFQTPEYIALLNEMVHDVRMIPLDGRAPLSPDIPQWMGSSRGRWEGDTLVVETANFSDKVGSFSHDFFGSVGSAEQMHLVERFRRVDASTLHYEFTVNDPSTYTRPFTAVLVMRLTELPIFEYACHEGNYGLYNMLFAARAAEKAVAARALNE